METINGIEVLRAYLIAMSYQIGQPILTGKQYVNFMNNYSGTKMNNCTSCSSLMNQNHNRFIMKLHKELLEYNYAVRVDKLYGRWNNDYLINSLNISSFNILNDHINKIGREYKNHKDYKKDHVTKNHNKLTQFKIDKLNFFNVDGGAFIKYLEIINNVKDVKKRKSTVCFTDAELVGCIESGMKAKDIAKKYEVSLSYVYRRKRELNEG